MNKKLMLIGIFLGTVSILFILYVINNKSDTAETGVPTVEFVESSQNLSTVPPSDTDNLKLRMYKFLDNGETVEDPSNQGNYILAGSLGYCLPSGECPGGLKTNDFSISYSKKDDFFTIVILNEPIAEVRKQAELFLQNQLEIGEAEMCQLHYTFSIPYWVNEFYAGRELGFSFCPGSVSLE